MSRVLGIELRRSSAIGGAVSLAVVGALAMYFAEGIAFSTGWIQLAMTQRFFLILLWPLMVAAGAWQARREHRSDVGELFATTPRPVPQRVAPTLGAMAIAAVAGYLVMWLAGAGWIFDTAGYLPVEVFVVTAVGALALVAASWLGLAVGRLLPSPATAPAAGVAALGLLLALPYATGQFGWLALVFSPAAEMNLPGDYATVPGAVSAAQGLWLIGLAAAAALLFASGGSRNRAAAALPAVLGAALAVAVIPHGDRIVTDAVDPVARELVCAEGTPQVCVSRAHEQLLPEVTAPAREALAVLEPLPGAPIRVHEDTSAFAAAPPGFDADTVLLPVDANRNGELANEPNVLADVVTGAFGGPPTCEEPPALADRLAAAHWLMGARPTPPVLEPLDRLVPRFGAEDASAEAAETWERLRAMPEDEALSRVAALRQAALACRPGVGLLR